MIELDDRLLALRAETRRLGEDLRAHALELDTDPDAIYRLLHLPGFNYLSSTLIPVRHQPEPFRVGPHRFYGMCALERVIAMEELSRGDAGGLLAAPGPSLSGVLVDELADDEQKQWYYGQLCARPTWTFFALTEPARGSDAGALNTEIKPSEVDGPWRLNGAKRYIGNGVRASIGVVIGRRSPGPLGITAAIVDTSAPGFHAEIIPTSGLRAARLSALTFTDVPIPADRILGRHLPASKRGMRGVVRTFNQLRPGVAALAVGVAGAALDYVKANRRMLSAVQRHELQVLEMRIATTRELVYRAAIAVDADPDAGAIGSAAKARAAALAEQATLLAPRFFGAGARLEHPMIDKLARDARGFEFMEGTSNVQKLTLFQGYLKGKVSHV
jgi:alkylation response protein AidB-like acyl-CoA dehydrogenase